MSEKSKHDEHDSDDATGTDSSEDTTLADKDANEADTPGQEALSDDSLDQDTEPTPDQPVEDDAPAQIEVAVKKPSRAPLALAIIAFFLALGSAASVGWLWQQQTESNAQTQSSQQLQRLSEQLAAARNDLESTQDSLGALQAASGQASGGLDDLQRSVDQRLRSLEAIPGRLSNLESSLSALQGISSGLRDTWLLAEAEYYLQIANAQLQLAGNPAMASIALELADERLASLGNPALTDVRRAVADEMRSLEALADIDLEGAVLTLSSLADAIQTLPLKNDIDVPTRDEPAVDAQLSGMDRALAALKSSMSDVISVRRTDQPVTPLLPPDAAYFLRSNLMLQLQTARLAMLRGERAVFEESLDDAASWINDYYDPASKPVQSALATVNELRDTRLTVSMPDISGSLTALRQFMALRSQQRRVQPESEQ